MKSWKTPTPEQVNRSVALLGHKEQIRYFFDRLENPKWIKPLEAKGFFSTPPEPQHDEERGTVGFPPWPEMRYLVRMTIIDPETVLEIVLKIPDDHGNVRIFEDLVDIALNLPPKLAVKLTERAKKWALSHYHFSLPEKIGALVGKMAEGEQVDAALDLAGALLEVLPDPKYDAKHPEDNKFSLSPKPTIHFDEWHYEAILKKEIPKLLKANGIRTFQLLCDLLAQAVQFSQREEDVRDNEDYSYIWRPAIEDHSKNRSAGIKGFLVKSVRDAALKVRTIDPSCLTIINQILKDHYWKVFHRIGLHLLRSFGKSHFELVTDLLTSRKLFEDFGIQHEYAMLLNEYFKELNQKHQDTILSWIDEGPDIEGFKESEEKWTGKPPTDEEVNQYRKVWQRDRLAWFKPHLPDKWEKTYRALVREFGEPKHPDLSGYGSSWIGPTSPKTKDDLQAMTVIEIVDFMTNWVPPDDRYGPSPEGLTRFLTSVVAKEPEKFVHEAKRFKGLTPTYIRALFRGFRDAYKENRQFPWDPILELCQWVVQQPRELKSKQTRKDVDQHWGHVRKTIADLLSSGFDSTCGNIPIETRENVWTILEPLTVDPEPTPENETSHFDSAKLFDSIRDPANYAINTTRGEALHATVRYALWVRRHLEKLPDSRERLAKGFDEMPEVRKVLEHHLNVSQDPSFAIRSVYGQWFPWLFLLDPKWAKEKVSEIFPLDESLRLYFTAAWVTYILYCEPYDDVCGVLSEHYEFAVSEILSESEKDRDDDYFDRLAEHLVSLYWRGKLKLDDLHGLLSKFWDNASPTLRGHALDFIGRSLCNTEGAVPDDVISRLQILWEKRLELAKKSQSIDLHKAEIKAFGLWFVSGKFDISWSMPQLLEALRITGKVERDYKVIEKLIDYVDEMSSDTVKCVELIAKGDREGWTIHGSRDEVKIILAKAIKTDAAPDVENTVHYLGNRGFLEFRDLLGG